MQSNDERWLPVPGFEGTYEVSDQGRARSLDRVLVDALGRHRRLRGQILKLTLTGTPPYPTVRISLKNGTGTNYRIHTLVTMAFLGPQPDGQHVRHLDDNKSNNKLSNLAYGTPAENNADMMRNQGHASFRQTHCAHGHEYTPENTYDFPSKPNHRVCRECARSRRRPLDATARARKQEAQRRRRATQRAERMEKSA